MSGLQHVKSCLSNQKKWSHLKAFISLHDPTKLRVDAERDCDYHAPHHMYPYWRLIAIKDNICTKDLLTTTASRILKDFKSPYDATVVEQLRDAGFIVAGKTNMDEFGMGSHSVHSFFGSVKQEGLNGEELSAGGSSGGSAVAVKTGQCFAALGTDTGGSVRLPAAYTGVVGFKPSYGLLSRWGVIAYANSFDTVGIFGADVDETYSIFETLDRHDPKDPTSLPPSTRTRIRSLVACRGYQPRWRIGIPLEYNIAELDPIVRSTWLKSLRLLQSKGHTLHPVSLPTTRHALSAYYILAPAEASSNLAKYDGVRFGTRADGPDGTPESVLFAKTRGQGFGVEVKRRILLGAFSLSADSIDNYFIQAQKIRRLVQREFDNVFSLPNPLLEESDSFAEVDVEKGVDVLICPTAPTLPPPLSSLRDQSPLDAYMNDVFTVPASLAGLPAVSVPVQHIKEDSSPTLGEHVGIQVIGQYGHDTLVMNVARDLEDAVCEDADRTGFEVGPL
ncbi:glutamyl-tRNA amidotransferase subunit A [Zopfia rhizophila CBS 207.26]|uniref:Glutamyl-tRNA(Gln) amidotransferase subunit A, mitochondrial n=1 Tax=Zopfia rhizophila CBS 207.26 TaxID=1314779 RepID=A0A6A6EFW8_9PEZI|nr:glutamyl-tRNA amidotransferase subunit A [Zopfia rhizophila CBS 207.26]